MTQIKEFTKEEKQIIQKLYVERKWGLKRVCLELKTSRKRLKRYLKEQNIERHKTHANAPSDKYVLSSTKYFFNNGVNSIKGIKSGVYLMKIGKEFYIGSTNNFQRRWFDWLNRISTETNKIPTKIFKAIVNVKNECCINPKEHRQEIYNILEFSILEVVTGEKEDLVKIEQKWINLLSPSLNTLSAKAENHYIT